MVDVMSVQSVRPVIGRLVVVGLGLIGGSFAKGMRESGLCDEVVGVDLDPESCVLAVELGVVDRCEANLAAACVGADVIQLAVPILAMEKMLGLLAGMDLGNAVLTDVGSAKGNVVRAAAQAFGGMPARFVPGHPIAGSEQSGVEASNASLFERHKVILTPVAQTDAYARCGAPWGLTSSICRSSDMTRYWLQPAIYLICWLSGWWTLLPSATRIWISSVTQRVASVISQESPAATR